MKHANPKTDDQLFIYHTFNNTRKKSVISDHMQWTYLNRKILSDHCCVTKQFFFILQSKWKKQNKTENINKWVLIPPYQKLKQTNRQRNYVLFMWVNDDQFKNRGEMVTGNVLFFRKTSEHTCWVGRSRKSPSCGQQVSLFSWF